MPVFDRSSSTDTIALTQLVPPSRQGWGGLVYAADVERQLRSVALRWRNREHVKTVWGFSRRVPADGLLCLFSGDSGTGKTAAASAIATELSIPLYRVNVAGIISKYVGETEKNLAQVLDSAEERKAALVFDEADAVFAKRTSEAKGSAELGHNQQVAYLLDRLERWNGLAFLTTNLGSIIDTAFKRRFHVIVAFDLPTPELRVRIWKLAVAEAPLASDVDFERLAKAELSGGSIQKAALNAAFAALEESSEIQMHHCRAAIEAELATAGKLSLS